MIPPAVTTGHAGIAGVAVHTQTVAGSRWWMIRAEGEMTMGQIINCSYQDLLHHLAKGRPFQGDTEAARAALVGIHGAFDTVIKCYEVAYVAPTKGAVIKEACRLLPNMRKATVEMLVMSIARKALEVTGKKNILPAEVLEFLNNARGNE